MRRQQPLSALDPNPIQPTEMSQSPCGKKRDGTTWGGDEEDLLYPQDGAVISRPWETFRLNSGPNPPNPSGMTWLEIPAQGSSWLELNFLDHVTSLLPCTWPDEGSDCHNTASTDSLNQVLIGHHSVPGSFRYWDYHWDQRRHSFCLQGIHTLGEDWDWKSTHHILIMVELWPYPRQ